jgi:hypothetical protein
LLYLLGVNAAAIIRNGDDNVPSSERASTPGVRCRFAVALAHLHCFDAMIDGIAHQMEQCDR